MTYHLQGLGPAVDPSPTLFAFLARRGANALERLVGMILIILSVQLILDGIDAYLDLRMIG